VAKHAKAQNVTVQVVREEHQMQVIVEDDGIGIQPKTGAKEQQQSFGLAGIKERIAMLGGVSRVTSAEGKGTRIEINVPAGEPAQVVERTLAQAANAVQRLN